MSSGNSRLAVPVNRDQPQPWGQPHVGQHFQCPLLIHQQSFRYAQQHTHNTIFTTGPAHGAVVAVDGHDATISGGGPSDILGTLIVGPFTLSHIAVLPIGLGRTVSAGTDNPR